MFLILKFCLFRVICEFEVQFEYECEKREKFEVQMDKLWVQIYILIFQLEDECSRYVIVVSIIVYKRVGRFIVKGCFFCGVLLIFVNIRIRGFKFVVGDEIVYEYFILIFSYY